MGYIARTHTHTHTHYKKKNRVIYYSTKHIPPHDYIPYLYTLLYLIHSPYRYAHCANLTVYRPHPEAIVLGARLQFTIISGQHHL